MEIELVKAVGFMGSPRRSGNTDALVDAVLAGAAEAGAETHKVVLASKKILPCTACDHCHRTGECIHEDDMDELLDLMMESHVWVLGTPVYWWGPTAQMKTFIDRWYQAYEDLAALEGRKVILVIPMGDSDESIAQPTVGMFEYSMDYLNHDIVNVILAPGVNGLAEVKQHADLMQTAYEAGKQAVIG
ncbi:MAG: flavodoxin family protein [Anaerolineae bacterium]|nr:flavodoxin family protein [Anaerolineae bacterium]